MCSLTNVNANNLKYKLKHYNHKKKKTNYFKGFVW